MKGRGLNSIPIRFAVMTGVLTTLCVGAQLYLWVGVGYEQAAWALIATVMGCAIVIPTTITWAAATKLTGQIRALRNSTEAIVAGDFDSPVDVDCACEVGGLADSFRKMVGRLNSNILRMNVLAYSDALTGLPNRIVATHMLNHLTKPGNSGQGAVLFIDLDGFKQVNDTLGHHAGDLLLRGVAHRLQSLMRDGDLAARLGGDEFAVLLPGAGCAQASLLAKSFIAALATPFELDGGLGRVGASIGIAVWPDHALKGEDVLRLADQAMYVAKRNKPAYAVHAPEGAELFKAA